jgi:HAE1 family hydrophobic/amphiphilic exporter-1
MVGEFFAIIPKTITFALLASLLECLLILPSHYLDFGPRRPPAPPDESSASHAPLQRYLDSVGEGAVMAANRRLLNHLLRLALRFRMMALGILTAGFLVSLYLFGSSMLGFTTLVRIQFFPENYALYYVELQMEAGTPIQTTDALVRQVAAAVMAQGPEMNESALGFAGFYINEDFSPQYGNHLGHVAVTLPESGQRRFADYPKNDVVAHLDTMRQRLAPLIPAGTTMTVRPEKDGPPAGKDVNIRVLGIQAENVSALAKRIDEFLRGKPEIAPWLTDLQDDQGSSGKVFRIRIDKQRVAENRLQVAQVARLAAAVMNGEIVGEMKLPEELIDIKLKTAMTNEKVLLAAFDMVVLDYPGGKVRLGDLCQPEYAVEPGSLNRFQQQRAITLTANLKAGAPISSAMVVKAVRDFYSTIRNDYPGAALNFSGEHESTRESFLSLAYAFALAIMLIYLILAAQFRSYLQPLIIISAVIFAITGVIYGAFLFRTIFTINSFVAVVGVTGVVVNDSLMLVEFLNSCYKRSGNRQEALLLATNIRLRPILLTTLTTTLGLLPMALGIPEYSLIWGSMAMTFVTGLCTATLLTIVIVPVQWDILISWNERSREV